ncbi:MAG: DUF3833 domain-containing protein [Burkholderiaceae bacterium]
MINTFVKRLAVLLLAIALAGCAGIDPSSYRSEQPALDLARYFTGALEGHGMVLDRGGKVQRRFVVRIEATWSGDVGTLDEDFTWSDGKKERRVWTLRRAAADGSRWIGTAPDVIGEAQGVVAGNALNWRYTLDLVTDSGRYKIAFDDWMFLIDDRVMLNRAVMSFFGFRVGEVLISFRKLP